MVPLFWNGEIKEGFASWTTDFEFARFIFKKDARPGETGAIFAVDPQPEHVILNIGAMWARHEFGGAVDEHRSRGGPNHEALINFRDRQSEVILKSPLRLDDVVALCVQIPSLESLCARLGVKEDALVDAVWPLMVKREWLPTSALWSEGKEAQAQLDRTIDKIRAWLALNVRDIVRYRAKE